jgi:hypothetical protein
VIFRPELVETILAGESEAARILEPGYVGSVRRHRARWLEENRAAWGENTTKGKLRATGPSWSP